MGEAAKKCEENIDQKRNITIMSNRTKRVNSSNSTRGFWETIKEFWVVIAAVFGGIFYVITTLTNHEDEIKGIKEDIAEIKGDYENINTSITSLTELAESDHEIFIDISSKSKEEEAYKLSLRDDYKISTYKVQNEVYLSEPLWAGDNLIGNDEESDIVYKAETLYNTLILTSYEDGGNEVYFLGRFNENNHWNGKCIMNVYKGNNLLFIFEGMYDDGELFSYKRVSNENDGCWTVNDRVKETEYNRGETWEYEKEKEFTKEFTLENVKQKQIMTVESFVTSIDNNNRLLSYYSGRTYNGKYEDETGNAYLVKYKDDGNVDILYKGNFVNGNFHDTDNNAKSWFVKWGNNNDGYYFYQGKFTDGKHGKEQNPWEPLEQEEIDEIVNPKEYQCKLTGLIK